MPAGNVEGDNQGQGFIIRADEIFESWFHTSQFTSPKPVSAVQDASLVTDYGMVETVLTNIFRQTAEVFALKEWEQVRIGMICKRLEFQESILSIVFPKREFFLHSLK